MTFTTDDLRRALREAADQPGAASGSRLDGVRAAVRRSRRRRTGAAVAATGALVAAVLALSVGSGPSTSHRQAPPPATSTSSPVTGGVPALWGPRDVAATVDGRGAEVSTTQLSWPRGASGVVVRCPDGAASVDVTLTPAGGPDISASYPCGGEEWSVHELPSQASGLTSGVPVQLAARADPGDPSGMFGVGLLTGRDLVDGSTMTPPSGFRRIASVALSHGFFYSWTGDGIDSSSATPGGSVDSAQLATTDQHEVRLSARCSGRSTVEMTGPDGEPLGAIQCPPGLRITREVSVPLTPSSDQRFEVRLTDADPGALVQIGLYGR